MTDPLTTLLTAVERLIRARRVGPRSEEWAAEHALEQVAHEVRQSNPPPPK